MDCLSENISQALSQLDIYLPFRRPTMIWPHYVIRHSNRVSVKMARRELATSTQCKSYCFFQEAFEKPFLKRGGRGARVLNKQTH